MIDQFILGNALDSDHIVELTTDGYWTNRPSEQYLVIAPEWCFYTEGGGWCYFRTLSQNVCVYSRSSLVEFISLDGQKYYPSQIEAVQMPLPASYFSIAYSIDDNSISADGGLCNITITGNFKCDCEYRLHFKDTNDIKYSESYVTIPAGTGDYTINQSITISANPYRVSRRIDIPLPEVESIEGKIVTDFNGAQISGTNWLTQSESSNPVEFRYGPTKLNLGWEEQTAKINVISNTSWDVSSNAEWLSLDVSDNNVGNRVIVATASQNTTGTNREAFISFSYEGNTDQVPVYQKGISIVDLTFSAAYTTQTIDLNAVGASIIQEGDSFTHSKIIDTDTLEITVEANTTGYSRTTEIIVDIMNDANRHFIITQLPLSESDPDGSCIPICEPKIMTSVFPSSQYEISKGNQTIYSAKVYRYPDSESLSFEINDVLSNYMSNHIQFTEGNGIMADYLNEYYISLFTKMGDVVMIETSETVYVYDAWEKPKQAILNDPINNLVDSRQFIFANYIDGYGDVSLYADGVEVDSSDGLNGRFYSTRVIKPCGSILSFDTRRNNTTTGILQYEVGDGSKDYVLYYVNAYGGWDSLLINGNVKRTDNFTSYSYRNKQNGKVKYMNEITPSWSLYTDDMNDGSKMYHLLESTEVYLHNLKTDEIIPVVISDSSCEYKTYANQGNTRFYYVINVEASKYKYRK